MISVTVASILVNLILLARQQIVMLHWKFRQWSHKEAVKERILELKKEAKEKKRQEKFEAWKRRQDELEKERDRKEMRILMERADEMRRLQEENRQRLQSISEIEISEADSSVSDRNKSLKEKPQVIEAK